MKRLVAAALVLFTALAFAQKGLTGKVVKIDPAKSVLTLAAVMGYKDMVVKNPTLLDKVKIGDTIQFVTAQEGNGLVITEIEVLKVTP
jgi:Cu/Ag efflux protein CusF